MHMWGAALKNDSWCSHAIIMSFGLPQLDSGLYYCTVEASEATRRRVWDL